MSTKNSILHIRPTSASTSGSVDEQSSAALRASILTGLRLTNKSLPTTILYDERGLELYDDITVKAPEYYLFGAEETILTERSNEIIDVMTRRRASSKGVLLELGAGSLRKTAHLISALSDSLPADAPSNYAYYALDLAPNSISQSLHSLAPLVKNNLHLRGLCTDYDSGLQWVRDGGLDRDLVMSRIDEEDEEGAKEEQELASTPRGRKDEWVTHSRQASGATVPVTGTPAVLPEEGWRIPHPQPPPTPPHSKSRSRVRSDSAERTTTEKDTPLHLLFLGSSLGNFDRTESAKFLRSLPVRSNASVSGAGDTLLLGLDGRNEKSLVETAYNDPAGYTAKFILNGLTVVESALGIEMGQGKKLEDHFAYVGRFNEEIGRHEAYYQAKYDFTLEVPAVPGVKASALETIAFAKDELIHIEYSYKYSDSDAHALFAASNLRPLTRWQDPKSLYSLWLLERPPFSFPLIQHPEVSSLSIAALNASIESADGKRERNPFGMPTLEEWNESWKLWDTVTLDMIPKTMLFEKPIDLRHMCLFYLGHIPAFLDIHLSRLLREPHTEPEYFKDIFERGIDPHVDDPTQIHPHSEVPTRPEDWPSLESVLSFRDRVRDRVRALYMSIEEGNEKVFSLGRKVGRVLWMCLEHEGWHAETLLYMLIQRAGTPGGTIPPPGFSPPLFLDSLTAPISGVSTLNQEKENDLVVLAPQSLLIGHDDFEAQDPEVSTLSSFQHEFGWDNEHPKRTVEIEKEVRFEKRCVNNGEYVEFLKSEEGKDRGIPGSWVRVDGEVKVRTLYGPVALEVAAKWPLVSSYDDLAAFAKWKGGRLPNEFELRAFMDQHLGAETSNIGFKEWSFTEPVLPDPASGKRGHNGGAWEWTSTLLDTHADEGFIPSIIYPGYSSDFFDGLHHVVLGGSFATIPRIAQRRSVRNYYQHNYPYAWVAGRVVYDA